MFGGIIPTPSSMLTRVKEQDSIVFFFAVTVYFREKIEVDYFGNLFLVQYVRDTYFLVKYFKYISKSYIRIKYSPIQAPFVIDISIKYLT